MTTTDPAGTRYGLEDYELEGGVHDAVIDALSHLGVRHIDMPCTSQRVWEAVAAAETGTLPPVWRDPPAAMADLPLLDKSARPEAADVDI